MSKNNINTIVEKLESIKKNLNSSTVDTISDNSVLFLQDLYNINYNELQIEEYEKLVKIQESMNAISCILGQRLDNIKSEITMLKRHKNAKRHYQSNDN